MPDITPNHPAVEAATFAQWSVQSESHWCPYADVSDVTKDRWRKGTALALTAALPHLTADDLRDTDAAEEIRTEGWLQGWAAGRDLDGDEDATPYLRNTPAGRALMAEAWEAGVAQFARYGDVDTNPYRKEGNA